MATADGGARQGHLSMLDWGGTPGDLQVWLWNPRGKWHLTITPQEVISFERTLCSWLVRGRGLTSLPSVDRALKTIVIKTKHCSDSVIFGSFPLMISKALRMLLKQCHFSLYQLLLTPTCLARARSPASCLWWGVGMMPRDANKEVTLPQAGHTA